MKDHTYFVYVMALKCNGTLYTGATNDIYKRVIEHRAGKGSEFVFKHKVFDLIWFETQQYIDQAIGRAKSIKRWRRKWKLELIGAENSQWHDLHSDMAR